MSSWTKLPRSVKKVSNPEIQLTRLSKFCMCHHTVQAELRKANTLRDRLEDLCRTLQRENKERLEENKLLAEQDLQQRQALQLKFSEAINEVSTKVEKEHEDRAKQAAENDSLRSKLGDVLKQFESFSQLLQGKDLEIQLGAAKLEQQQHICEQLLAKLELLQKANESLNEVNSVRRSILLF